MVRLFEPLTLRGLTLENRIMMAPMCQNAATEDGMATDWHFIHYPSRAIGGTGLLMFEATAVEGRGRIGVHDLGLWDDRQIDPLARIVKKCHEYGAKAGIQLAHAGRKAFSDDKGYGPELAVAPSPLPFDEGWQTPKELTLSEIDQIVDAFRAAARRALLAGFDVIEFHAAHGYLISEFLSPLVNKRQDEHGETLEGRMRFLHRAVEAVREVWPDSAPLFIRLSVTDWVPGGMGPGQMAEVVKTLPARGVDLVDCSSGSVVPAAVPTGPGYQVPLSHRIKRDTGVPTAAVGLITAPEMAEEILHNQRADLIALGRELLRHPYWPHDAARQLGVDLPWPPSYRRAAHFTGRN